MKPVDTYRWRYFERGRWKTTTFHCTSEHISAENPEAEPVEGTLRRSYEPEDSDDLLRTVGLGNDGTIVG